MRMACALEPRRLTSVGLRRTQVVATICTGGTYATLFGGRSWSCRLSASCTQHQGSRWRGDGHRHLSEFGTRTALHASRPQLTHALTTRNRPELTAISDRLGDCWPGVL